MCRIKFAQSDLFRNRPYFSDDLISVATYYINSCYMLYHSNAYRSRWVLLTNVASVTVLKFA